MKKTILTLVAIGAAASVMAQGTINFSTRVSPAIIAHVYGVEGSVQKSGNTASESPTGTQTYLGALLTGSGFSAQLWGGTLGALEGNLVAIGSPSTFRTGATLGGTPVPQVLAVPFVPPAGSGTFQVRAWDNQGGTITTWAAAAAANHGVSALFDVSNLGDGVLTLPADMVNFRSFNLITTVPEPSTFVLAGLGAAGLLIFRRRK